MASTFLKTILCVGLTAMFCLTNGSDLAFGQFPGDQHGKQLVRFANSFPFDNVDEAGANFGTDLVPENKILIIEYAAASLEQSSNPVQFEGPSFRLDATNLTGQTEFEFILPITDVDPAGWRAEAALRTKVVLKPHEGINVFFSNFAKISSGFFRVAIEGYFVPDGSEFSTH